MMMRVQPPAYLAITGLAIALAMSLDAHGQGTPRGSPGQPSPPAGTSNPADPLADVPACEQMINELLNPASKEPANAQDGAQAILKAQEAAKVKASPNVSPAPANPEQVTAARQAAEMIDVTLRQKRIHVDAARTAIDQAKREKSPIMQQFYLNAAKRDLDSAQNFARRAEEDLGRAMDRSVGSSVSVAPALAERRINFHSPTFESAKSEYSRGDVILKRAFTGGNDETRGGNTPVPISVGPEFFKGVLPPPPPPSSLHSQGAGPVKEPGGIKFNGDRADALPLPLDVTAIDYDPARGRMVLVGPKSSEVFDLDVFADVLQLATERYEPFFSLDPSNTEDWDSLGAREFELLRQRYQSADDIARRIRAINPKPIEHDGRQYYYATTEQLDPDLAAEARRGLDITSKLVFSPAWLRYSKLGWMLYEADLAIKSVASGFLNRGSIVVPAPSWQIPGFDPEWIHRDQSNAGRANFELDDDVPLPRKGTRIDLSKIRPKLDVVERKAGTSIDVGRSERTRAISDHFRDHWQDYAREVPEIGRLMVIYRAYVAARFLVKEHPGLAARIRDTRIREMPPPIGADDLVPLRVVQPHVIRVAFENGQLVSIVPGEKLYVDLGGGYGGGTAFKFCEQVSVDCPKINIKPGTVAAVAPDDWVRGATRTAAAGGFGWVEQDKQAAAVLEFAANEMSSATMRAVLAVFGLVAATGGVAGLFARQFDWQRISQTMTCAHCVRVHATLGCIALVGDIISITTVFYLAALPLMLATQEEGPDLMQMAMAGTLLGGLTAALFIAGTVILSLIAFARNNKLVSTGFVPSLFCGARIVVLGLAVVLLHRGWSGEAVAEQIFALTSLELGERMVAMLGGPMPIIMALTTGAFAATFVALLRWVGPFLFDSRPLAFLPSEVHSHQKHRKAHA